MAGTWSPLDLDANGQPVPNPYNAAAPARVTSFVAVLKPEHVTMNNIRVVWYRRNADNTWTTTAWSDSDHSVGIAHIKQQLAIPDSDDPVWLDEFITVPEADDSGGGGVGPGVGVGGGNGTVVGTPSLQPGNGLPGSSYSNGFYNGDPLQQAVATLPDPDGALLLLTDSGYESAFIPLESTLATAAVPLDERLSRLALVEESAAIEASESVVTGHLQSAGLADSPWLCGDPIVYATPQRSVPGTWVQVGPAMIGKGVVQRNGSYVVQCTMSITSCYVQERFVYRVVCGSVDAGCRQTRESCMANNAVYETVCQTRAAAAAHVCQLGMPGSPSHEPINYSFTHWTPRCFGIGG